MSFHKGERKQALNAPKRPGIPCLLLGFLLAGSALFSASQLEAQPPLPGPIPIVSPKGGSGSDQEKPGPWGSQWDTRTREDGFVEEAEVASEEEEPLDFFVQPGEGFEF